MNIDDKIDQVAEKMEKSTKTERDLLKDTIKTIGAEGLKKAIPQLSDSQKLILKDVVADMIKSMELDFSKVTSPVVTPKVVEGKIQEEQMSDDEDEKIAVAAKNESHRHQGGSSTEGWEGQVIKSEEVNMTTEEMIKSLSDEQKDELATKLLAKGMPSEKVEKLIDKKIKTAEKKEDKEDKKEHKEFVKKGEELIAVPQPEEKQTGSVDQMTEGTSRAKKETVKDLENDSQTVAKSVKFTDSNALLKANTLGRNHHFSVNGYYDQVIAKSKEEGKDGITVIQKSEKVGINEMLEKSMDCTADEVKAKKMLEDSKKKVNGQIKKSFTDKEIQEALGLSDEDAKKLLGE